MTKIKIKMKTKMKRSSVVIATLALFFSLGSQAQGPKITYTTTPGKMRIKNVEKGSIFEMAGFKDGDVVKEIDGKVVDDNSTPMQLNAAIRAGKKIVVDRKGKAVTLKPKPMPEDETMDMAPPSDGSH